MIEEDKELTEMKSAEEAFSKATALHRQHESALILKRIKFQQNCPHKEFVKSEIIDLFNYAWTLKHCTRCGKLIEKTESKDAENLVS